MRLTDLEARWVDEAREDGSSHWTRDGGLAGKQGVIFLCPKCFAANGGPVGTHSIIVPFRDRGVPDGYMPGMARWAVEGTDFNDLTTKPSILIIGGCEWHGFITSGDAA